MSAAEDRPRDVGKGCVGSACYKQSQIFCVAAIPRDGVVKHTRERQNAHPTMSASTELLLYRSRLRMCTDRKRRLREIFGPRAGMVVANASAGRGVMCLSDVTAEEFSLKKNNYLCPKHETVAIERKR